MKSSAPKLTANLSSEAKELVQSHDLLFRLVAAFGSPLNLLFPELFSRNFDAFQAVLQERMIRGRVFFANKPNKSRAILREAVDTGCSLDVASVRELQNALGQGFRPERLEVTGPKNLQLLHLSLLQRVIVNVDNLAELQQIVDIQKNLRNNAKARVLLRLNGLTAREGKLFQRDSHFGIPLKDLPRALSIISSENGSLELLGLSVHLAAASPLEKIEAIEKMLELLHDINAEGIAASVIDIGGGFRINYLAERAEWDSYIEALHASLRGGESLSWNNSGLGLRLENGAVKGTSIFHEHYVDRAGAEEFADLLDSPLSNFDGRSIGSVVRESMFELWIEPGRALLDQVGHTIARVSFVKQSQNGESIIGLDMNRTNLNSVDLEMMVDPLPISQKGSSAEYQVQGYFLSGNLCLYNDLIFRHKVFFHHVPRAGDLLLFPNTAGYNMDFAESEVIQQAVARKVALRVRDSQFAWFLDEEYSPAHLLPRLEVTHACA